MCTDHCIFGGMTQIDKIVFSDEISFYVMVYITSRMHGMSITETLPLFVFIFLSYLLSLVLFFISVQWLVAPLHVYILVSEIKSKQFHLSPFVPTEWWRREGGGAKRERERETFWLFVFTLQNGNGPIRRAAGRQIKPGPSQQVVLGQIGCGFVKLLNILLTRGGQDGTQAVTEHIQTRPCSTT